MDSSEVWASAFDYAHQIERDETLSVDQRIQLSGVMALLAVGQELSALNPNNTVTYDREGGTKRNGWGMPLP